MDNRYKGIAIFGAPGSGKTTIANLLQKSFLDSIKVEASDLVIKPAFFIKNNLPKREVEFIETLSELDSGHSAEKISRDEARDFFIYLKNHYSEAVIAKTLINIHLKKFSGKFPVIAGIRGYANSLHFKKSGYLVIYLKTPDRDLTDRVSKRENFSTKEVENERAIEERLFSTNKVERVAHFSFNTATTSEEDIVSQIRSLVEVLECKKCVNSSLSPSVIIERSGLCDVCERYEKNFDKTLLKKEIELLISLKGTGKGKYDAMVGISGGKDSTATLYEVKKMGFNPLAFSLDTNYYPKHIFPRAKQVAESLSVDYEKIDARKYMRPVDRICFEKTAKLYDEPTSEELKEKFRKWYTEGRRHYSVKCRHKIPFVRTCQLCRRLIVRAYYGEAQKRGVSVVILGINEWAGLSQNSGSDKFVFSAVRKLQPVKSKPPVYIVHLPFLLQRTIKDTEKVLKKLGWEIPEGEKLIESNSNSCLFAKAAESKSREMLGFHPDTTRLAREVTVGFITKDQARKALDKIHDHKDSVKQVLEKAEII
jgi:broad-specificity NMP kinase/predicted PP-loop superfamily ATPase